MPPPWPPQWQPPQGGSSTSCFGDTSLAALPFRGWATWTGSQSVGQQVRDPHMPPHPMAPCVLVPCPCPCRAHLSPVDPHGLMAQRGHTLPCPPHSVPAPHALTPPVSSCPHAPPGLAPSLCPTAHPGPWRPPAPCHAHLPAPLSAQLLAPHPGYRLTTRSKELGWALRGWGRPGSSRGSRPGAHEGVRGSPAGRPCAGHCATQKRVAWDTFTPRRNEPQGKILKAEIQLSSHCRKCFPGKELGTSGLQSCGGAVTPPGALSSVGRRGLQPAKPLANSVCWKPLFFMQDIGSCIPTCLHPAGTSLLLICAGSGEGMRLAWG